MFRRTIPGVIIIILASLAATARGQTILYVDDSAPPGGSGTSWASPFDNLQNALLSAAASGGVIVEIRAAQGIYRPAAAGGDRNATFQLVSGVALKGGYAGFG